MIFLLDNRVAGKVKRTKAFPGRIDVGKVVLMVVNVVSQVDDFYVFVAG